MTRLSLALPAVLCLAALCLAAPAPAANENGADEHAHVEVTRARILNQKTIPVYGYRILKSYPHDTASYTEGLVYDHGVMYEGSGLYGHSKLRAWDLQSGRVLRETDVDRRYFGEGVTVLNGNIFELTYLANTGFVYNQANFHRDRAFRFISQGWGLTTDGTWLIMSDGSSSIQFVDPATLDLKRHIFVTDDIGPVGFLNELEYVNGKLYANVWQTNFIAIIDPASGHITGWLDLTGLNPDPKKLIYPLVLNGIAFDPASGHLLVTGKCWPHVWEIELVSTNGKSVKP